VVTICGEKTEFYEIKKKFMKWQCLVWVIKICQLVKASLDS